ncbi:MAG: MBL fold metallo-hydrolase [Desulfobacteraceae bacterium]|nr:MAG: MBL fold metallo-hydrolase [Desulfobacteraceae bacterium]
MGLLMMIGMLVLCFIIFAGYFLFLSGGWPKRSDFRVDWTFVRKLAMAGDQPLPLGINFLTVARGALPSWGVAAGDFSGRYRIDFPSFQIIYADKTGVLEAPFSKRLFDRFPYGAEYDQKAYEIMQQAMLQAAFIVPTHEHWDHLGGIAQSPHLNRILPKTVLTRKQINGPTIRDAEFPAQALENYKPLDYEQYCRVAPGVVLIDAPGHSRGHQLIYVQLQNGREYLFTGDIVWVTANLEKKKARPRLANIRRRENRGQIAHQMKWLYEECFHNPENKIIFVTTHDPEQHEQYIQKGLLGDGFEILHRTISGV